MSLWDHVRARMPDLLAHALGQSARIHFFKSILVLTGISALLSETVLTRTRSETVSYTVSDTGLDRHVPGCRLYAALNE